MAIDSVLNPVGMAKKLSVTQLQKAIQDGLIPPYVGIPILQEKVQLEQRMRNSVAQPQQGPTVAQQVMAEAQGLDQLPSNLPVQLAGGGIVAFARGGGLDGDFMDDDDEDNLDKDISRTVEQINALRERSAALNDIAAGKVVNFPSSITFPGLTSTEVKKGVSIKEGDQPTQTVEQTEKRISRPAVGGDLVEKIRAEAKAKNIDPDLAVRIAQNESSLIPNASGKTSTAGGLFGVIDSTWKGFGGAPGKKYDPQENIRVGTDVIASNTNYLRSFLGREPSGTEVYAAHFFGPAGAKKFLSADLKAPSNQVFSDQVLEANPQLKNKTVGEIKNMLARKMGESQTQRMAEGGIARFQFGGQIPDLSGLSIDEIRELARKNAEIARGGLPVDSASPKNSFLDKFFGQSPQEMRAAAERRLRMEQARGAFSAAPAAPVTPAAPASPASPIDERSLLRRGSEAFGRGVASFTKDLMRTGPLARGLGIGALLTPSSTNVGEMEELERRRQMPPTITATEKLTPMAPSTSAPIVPSGSAATSIPAKPLPPTGAGAGRGVQGGPTAEELRRNEFEKIVGATQDTEDLEGGLAMAEMDRQRQAEAEAAKQKAPAEDEFGKSLRDRLTKGYDKLAKQEESDKYLSLLAAGLGMMGGGSPYAMANIGRGGMMGIQALQQAEASRAAQERGLMSAELGLERYGQYGALQRELAATRAETARQERERKEEATRLGIEQKVLGRARQEKEDAMTAYTNFLKTAQAGAIANSKNALTMTDQEKQNLINGVEIELLKKPSMRQLYKTAFGIDPPDFGQSMTPQRASQFKVER